MCMCLRVSECAFYSHVGVKNAVNRNVQRRNEKTTGDRGGRGGIGVQHAQNISPMPRHGAQRRAACRRVERNKKQREQRDEEKRKERKDEGKKQLKKEREKKTYKQTKEGRNG